jgi:hypothetical protein
VHEIEQTSNVNKIAKKNIQKKGNAISRGGGRPPKWQFSLWDEMESGK